MPRSGLVKVCETDGEAGVNTPRSELLDLKKVGKKREGLNKEENSKYSGAGGAVGIWM